MQNVFYKEAHSLLPGVKCSGNQFTIPGLECSGNQRAGHRKLSTLQDISARFQDPHSQITSVPDPSPVRHPAVFQSARTLQDFPASLLEFTCLLHLAATCSSGTSYRFCSAAVVPGSADPLPLQQQSSQSYRLCSSPPRFCSRPLTATAVLPLQEQSSHCRSSPPTAAAVLPVLQVLQQPSQVLQQASRCNSSPPTAATVLSVLQALQQPSQVVQQDSHCNSSPLTAATVLPLQQQCSQSQSYRFCSSPPRFCSRPPTATAVLPLQQQSSHCSSSPSSPTGSAATLPGFLAVLPVARPLTVDRGVQLPRPVRCDLDGRARSATGGKCTDSRGHFSPSSQPEKTN